VSDLNVVLDAMSELVAVSMATSSVRDSGGKRRKGDHQDLSHVSHVMTLVNGVFIDLPRRSSFLRSVRKAVASECVMVYEKEWMGSVKEAGAFSRWNGVAFEDGKECVQLCAEAISRTIAKRVCVRECAVKDREGGATRQTVIPNGDRRRSDGRNWLTSLHLPRERRMHIYTTDFQSHAASTKYSVFGGEGWPLCLCISPNQLMDAIKCAKPFVCMSVKPAILPADWLPGGRLASGNLHELAGASATRRATYLSIRTLSLDRTVGSPAGPHSPHPWPLGGR
jgi:hypothetical protein